MKKIQLLLIGALLSSISVAQSAQEEYAPSVSDFKVGDTIWVNTDSMRYLTGERISKWVYYRPHVIRQVGGPTHPGGVLVGGIDSWIYPATAITPEMHETRVNEVKKTATSASQPQPMGEPALMQSSEPVQVQPSSTSQQEAKPQESAQPAPTSQPEAKQQESAQPAPTSQPEAKQQESAQPSSTSQPEVKQQESAQPAPTPVLEEVPQESVEPSPTPFVDNSMNQDVQQKPTQEYSKKQVSLYEYNRFSIGLRGGVAGYISKFSEGASGNMKWGYMGMLDLQYAHYWNKSKHPNESTSLGILTGINIGYMNYGLNMSTFRLCQSQSTQDGQIDYTITANKVQDTYGCLQLEIPLLFSMITKGGFFLNVGPKFMVPVVTMYSQGFDNGNIAAYFSKEDVTVWDAKVTGKYETEHRAQSGKVPFQRNINLLLDLQLGYEWRFANENSLGLGLYADYGCYSLFKSNISGMSLVSIKAPQSSTNPTDNAIVEVSPISSSVIKQINYLDAGIKLTYHFNFHK